MYDEDDEGLNFNPYTNSYDDAYGDYYFDDVEEEISTCRLGEDGKPKFNGELSVQTVGGRRTMGRGNRIPRLQ